VRREEEWREFEGTLLVASDSESAQVKKGRILSTLRPSLRSLKDQREGGRGEGKRRGGGGSDR
jgi:hypothetical protein